MKLNVFITGGQITKENITNNPEASLFSLQLLPSAIQLDSHNRDSYHHTLVVPAFVKLDANLITPLIFCVYTQHHVYEIFTILCSCSLPILIGRVKHPI